MSISCEDLYRVSSLSLVGHKQQVFVSQSSTIHMDRHLVLGSQDNCQKRDNRRSSVGVGRLSC